MACFQSISQARSYRATSTGPGVNSNAVPGLDSGLSIVKDNYAYVEIRILGQFFRENRYPYLCSAERPLAGGIEERIAIKTDEAKSQPPSRASEGDCRFHFTAVREIQEVCRRTFWPERDFIIFWFR